MFSRVDTGKGTRSRKRQKVSHTNEHTGEPSTRPSKEPPTSQNPETGPEPDMDNDIAEENVRHEKEHGVIEEHLEAMRQLITCKICQRFLTEPYGLACGHTYCYICLDTWLVTQKKVTCPECRASVKQQPVPSLIIREMVQMFSVKEQLLPEGETVEELKANADEAADKVAKDKSDAQHGLFKGMFANAGRVREPFYDHEDNVERCPICFHEIEDGLCTGCGEPMVDFPDERYFNDDFYDEGDIFGLQDDGNVTPRVPREILRGIQMGLNRRNRARRLNRRAESMNESSEDNSSEEDEETDLEGFVVPDDATELREQDEDRSSSSLSSATHSSARRGNRTTRSTNTGRAIVLSDSDDESETDPADVLVTSRHTRRQPRRSRMAQRSARRRSPMIEVTIGSSEEDEEDDEEDDDDEDDAPVGRARRARKSRDERQHRPLPRRALTVDSESDAEVESALPSGDSTPTFYFSDLPEELDLDDDNDSDDNEDEEDEDHAALVYAAGGGDILDLSQPSEYGTATSDEGEF